MTALRRGRWAILVVVVAVAAGGGYLLTRTDEGGPPAEGQAYIGRSLTALRLDANGRGPADRRWARYAGPDAPEGAFLGTVADPARDLSATVTLKQALPAGTYYARVKAIDYDHHATVRLALGGGEAKLETDDRDQNGYWTAPARLEVGSSSDQLTITLLGQPGAARLMLRGLYLTPHAGETVLADDRVVDLAYPRERDTSPPRPGNLLRNASFETGLGHGWGFASGRRFSVASTWDRTRGADGAASVRLPLDPGSNSAAVTGLSSTAYAVAPNKRHTLSAWVRTDDANTAAGSIRLVNSYDPATSGPLPAGQPAQPAIARSFEVGSTWKRISVTGVLLAYPSAQYSVAIDANVQPGRHLWIDGVSLNEGGPVPYAPHAALEVGLTSDRSSNLYYDDEPQTWQLRVANGTAARRRGLVRYEIFDSDNRRVRAGRRTLTVPPRAVVSRRLDLGPARRGAFRIVLWVEGQEGSQEEVLYGVVPRPQRAGADRGSAIGIHSNFQAFTYDAIARLGIKWDRALSPATFFRWQDVEPHDDDFTWFDGPVALARRRGVTPMGVLGTNNYWPAWADRNGLPDLDKWEEFVTQVATRYRGDVGAWEIWNEPLRTFTADFYARMLKRASDAIARADPGAMVVGMGGAASADEVKAVVGELEQQFPQWPWKQHIDALSIHMYPTGESADQAGAGLGATYRQKVVDVYRKPVWNTESGSWDRGNFHTENAPVADWGRQLQDFKTAAQFTDAAQLSVERLARNFVESVGDGLSKYFYYDMRIIASPTFYDAHPTMLEYDDSIRPKGIAYAVLARVFDHASGLGRVRTRDAPTQAYLFARPGEALAAVYAPEGGQRALTLPGVAMDRVTVYDSMGEELAPHGDAIVYGRRPVYVRAPGISAARLRAALRAASVRPVPDTRAPNLTIDEGPRGPLSRTPVRLRWSAADDNDTPSYLQPDAITYSYRLRGPGDAGTWSPWTTGNGAAFADLEPGRHVFAVRARDRAGNRSRDVTRSFELERSK